MQITEFMFGLGFNEDAFSSQFEGAYKKLYKFVCDKISAVEDFETFCTMMTARNTQLNLQALRHIEHERAFLNHNTQISNESEEPNPSGSGGSGSNGQRGGPIFSPRSSQASEEEEIKRTIEDSKRLNEEAFKMRQAYQPMNQLASARAFPALGKSKGHIHGFEDINIDDNELILMTEELKEPKEALRVR